MQQGILQKLILKQQHPIAQSSELSSDQTAALLVADNALIDVLHVRILFVFMAA